MVGSRGRTPALKPGQTIAHYRIERLIGQGGMGAVFLAGDTKLHRKVALKVLPAEMASHADRLARFQREAQAVAALTHPHKEHTPRVRRNISNGRWRSIRPISTCSATPQRFSETSAA